MSSLFEERVVVSGSGLWTVAQLVQEQRLARLHFDGTPDDESEHNTALAYPRRWHLYSIAMGGQVRKMTLPTCNGSKSTRYPNALKQLCTKQLNPQQRRVSALDVPTFFVHSRKGVLGCRCYLFVESHVVALANAYGTTHSYIRLARRRDNASTTSLARQAVME